MFVSCGGWLSGGGAARRLLSDDEYWVMNYKLVLTLRGTSYHVMCVCVCLSSKCHRSIEVNKESIRTQRDKDERKSYGEEEDF